MPWFKADDRLPDHRKVRQLGKDRLASMGLWLLSGCWSSGALSDGFVPAEVSGRFHPQDQAVRQAAEGLVRVGLWVPETVDAEPGHRFHDWPDWQPTRSQVESDREAAKERQRKARARGRSNGDGHAVSHSTVTANVTRNGAVTNGVTHAARHANVPDPDPARPDPARPGVPGGTPGGEGARAATAPVALASGGPPLPSELDDHEPTTSAPAAPEPVDEHWPEQRCGRRHDPDVACGRCGRARRAEQDATAVASAERQAADRAVADVVAGCRMCDVEGRLLEVGRFMPVSPTTWCDHETDQRQQVADARDEAS